GREGVVVEVVMVLDRYVELSGGHKPNLAAGRKPSHPLIAAQELVGSNVEGAKANRSLSATDRAKDHEVVHDRRRNSDWHLPVLRLNTPRYGREHLGQREAEEQVFSKGEGVSGLCRTNSRRAV